MSISNVFVSAVALGSEFDDEFPFMNGNDGNSSETRSYVHTPPNQPTATVRVVRFEDDLFELDDGSDDVVSFHDNSNVTMPSTKI